MKHLTTPTSISDVPGRTRMTNSHRIFVFGTVGALLLGACGKKPAAPEPHHVGAVSTVDAAATAPDAASTPSNADALPSNADALPSNADAVAPDGSSESFDRSKRPTPTAIAELKVPVPETFTLDNGLQVYLLTTDTLPTVTMTFEFDVGIANDPPDKVGLASVCFDLYSEGTERLDKVHWSEALADHAVSLYSPAGLETSVVKLESLVSELDPGLDLLAELLTSPGMRKSDFDRIIADRKASLTQSRGTANGVSSRLFGSLVWGEGHPYGPVQTDKHLDAMKLADCKAWVAQLRPDGARLWVAGKVTRESLSAALNQRLAKWTGKAPVSKAIAAAPKASGTLFAVQIDGAVQSMVIVADPGPMRTAEDYEATHLMAQIFGGGFASRVNMNLREAKGYAYGSSGRFSYRKGGSQLSISASVESSTTALSLREISSEIHKMRDTLAIPEELLRERDGALLALPARFAQASDALDELRAINFFGLPFTWFATYQDHLKAVDLAAIQTAAKAHLAPGEVVVLVVGDLTKPAKDAEGKTIRDELQKLADEKVFGSGGLVLLDTDGQRL